MSTRATVHFQHVTTHTSKYNPDTKGYDRTELPSPRYDTAAIVYRHSDGYPEGLGADLVRFIAEVSHLSDSRLTDASYLAAKWVVFDVLEYQAYMARSNAEREKQGEKPYYSLARLGFLGTGIVLDDPGDIEYRYFVRCDGRIDEIVCEHESTQAITHISTHVERVPA